MPVQITRHDDNTTRMNLDACRQGIANGATTAETLATLIDVLIQGYESDLDPAPDGPVR